MIDHVVPVSPCPKCGVPSDRAAQLPNGLEDAAPKPGDLTICFRCGGLLVFADDLTFRELTPAELEAIDADELIVVARAQAALREFWKREMH